MIKLVLTCEHGGNQIPDEYADLFQGQQELLASHRGYDLGALDLFDDLRELADISFYSETSRLLVELNRSLHHRHLFSTITKNLPEPIKASILQEYYYPYRGKVEQLIQDFVFAGRHVLHISVHSFTPELDGEVREADIGLLYDPKRKFEQAFCRAWKQALKMQDPDLVVRYNYPYLGTADGFPTYLRRKFSPKEYIGLELEVNQKFVQGEREKWQQVKQTIKTSLSNAYAAFKVEGNMA